MGPLALALVVLLAGTAGAAADTKAPAAIKCPNPIQKYLAHASPGAFYYVEENGRPYCGWSFAEPESFDLYPSIEQRAFTACQNGAERNGFTLPCLLVARGRTFVATSYADARRQAGDKATVPDRWRCGQEPGNRFYWVERGWCDVAARDAHAAEGVILWNAGISGTTVSHTYPPALALRLLLSRGWEVLKLNRHNLGEGQHSRWRTGERMMEEVKALRAAGFRRIVVAGQSFGGLLTLDAAGEPGFHGAIAFAPGLTSLRDGDVYSLIAHMLPDRIALAFPKDDLLFGSVTRGPGALAALRARRGAHVVVDEETGGLTGHGGGTGGNFALRHGRCLAEFISAPTVPEGAFPCPPPARWDVARELIVRAPDDVRIIRDRDQLPAPVRDLAGVWYGLVGDAIVAVAPVQRPGKPFALMVRESGRGQFLNEVDIGNREVRGVLRNRSTFVLRIVTPTELAVVVTAPNAGASNFAQTTTYTGVWKGVLTRVDGD